MRGERAIWHPEGDPSVRARDPELTIAVERFVMNETDDKVAPNDGQENREKCRRCGHRAPHP